MIPPPPKSEPRRLPGFVFGEGERHHNCARYDECLTRFVQTPMPAALRRGRRTDGQKHHMERDEEPAHCPPGCPSRDDIPSHVRHELAHVYGARAGKIET